MEPLISTPKPTSRKGAYILAAIAVLGAIAGVVAAAQYHTAATKLAWTASDLNAQATKDLFEQWKLAHGKVYSNAAEESHRFQTFQDNYLFIINWNADPTQTSQVGLNEYADLNTAEFSALKGCLNIERKNTTVKNVDVDVVAAPASWNWATQGAVTPIKNQGDCGSCWAFSTTGSLEGLNFLQGPKKGTLLSFSEQQLVDCSTSYGNQGCNGGLMDYAFEYSAAKGNEQEATYPYTGVQGTCKYNAAQTTKVNTGYTNVAQDNQVALLAAVAVQPVSIAIEADQPVFQLYTSGVITSASCGTSLDHGVLNVGWGTSGSQAYWIVKNSWGASWGNQGFVWIAKTSTTTGPGICGIAMMPSFPTN
jgi:KDEL-tailed cysteine endopeptidase